MIIAFVAFIISGHARREVVLWLRAAASRRAEEEEAGLS
jgi:hypothetical protein